MTTAKQWIEHLHLQPHPEGGYYREVYRSGERIVREHLPPRFSGDRAFSTSIYFLLESDDMSAFHRIRQDEVWHFYDGTALLIHAIDPDGRYDRQRLGKVIANGEMPQAVVPAGHLFGATVEAPNSYALVGCTVAPGFEFDDFEMPTRADLLKQIPQHRELVMALTR